MKRCVIRSNRSVTWMLRCHESWERHRIWFWGVGCPVVADDIGGRQSELTWWPQRNIQRKNIWHQGMTDLSIHHGAKRERDSQNEWHLHYILSYSLKVLACMCTRACVSLMKFFIFPITCMPRTLVLHNLGLFFFFKRKTSSWCETVHKCLLPPHAKCLTNPKSKQPRSIWG